MKHIFCHQNEKLCDHIKENEVEESQISPHHQFQIGHFFYLNIIKYENYLLVYNTLHNFSIKVAQNL